MKGQWSSEDEAVLMSLWGKMTCEQIGKRELSAVRTKNSVIGHGHRMGLPLIGASPKRKKHKKKAKRKSPTKIVHAEALLAATAQLDDPDAIIIAYDELQQEPKPQIMEIELVKEEDEIADLPLVAVPEPEFVYRHCCAWPIGEPGTKGFRFCGEAAQFGKPYCHEHSERAYLPTPKRRRVEQVI